MVCNQKNLSLRGYVRKRIFQLSRKALGLCAFSLAACALFFAWGEMDGEGAACLQNDMGEEFPYLSQDDLEEQFMLRLKEDIYNVGDIASDDPLLLYQGEILDYIVLHQKARDKKEAEDTQYVVSVFLQPLDEGLPTAMVDLAVHNGSFYTLSFHGSLDVRVDFRDIVGAKEKIVEAFGLAAESGDVKVWYQGTFTVGKDGAESDERKNNKL